jgi:hypothetical protein
MKTPVLFCLFMFSLNALFAQSKSQISDRNIKSITQHITDERKDDKTEKTTVTRYDKHGNEMEQIEYNDDSTIAKWEKRLFNKKNEETFFQELDKKGRQKKKVVSSFDAFGNKIEELTYNPDDSLTERSVFVFNNFNEKISESVYDKNGKLKTRAVYEYESKGMIKSKTIYNAENAVIYKRTYKYEY